MGEKSSIVQDGRHYDNEFPKYSLKNSVSITDFEKQDLDDAFKEKLAEQIKNLLCKFEENKSTWDKKDDQSIYTGLCGIAMMFNLYGQYFDDPTYVSKAAEMVHSCVSKLNCKRQVTFLTGSAGPLALGAVLHDNINKAESQAMISKLKLLSKYVVEDNIFFPDELLYGRAGYLFCLLFVNKHITPSPFDDSLIKQVIQSILKSGKNYSAQNSSGSPLMYAWHETEYLGGAHGLGGILYLLLQAREYLTESELKNEIEPSLKYLQQLKFPSGNFPSSLGRETDKLIHWCHGAPSMTMLFSLACKIFGDENYLKTAVECGEVIWQRGLLIKGCGICHGTAGNAYSFLNLYQETKEIKYLYRACKFAEWCFDLKEHQREDADRPFSLFEGLAGTIYFLIDMQKPQLAKFPGFTL